MAVIATRRRVLITGAAGGMGRACARLFGATHDLVLTDTSAALDTFAAELRDEGFVVAEAPRGDLGDEDVLAALAAALSPDAAWTLLHSAGLSPALGHWRAIMDVNLVATVRLLDALEPRLAPGSVAVLIASVAGHMAPALPDADRLTADPLAPGFLDDIGALVETMTGGAPAGMSGMAYVFSKAAVLRLVEQRAFAWGPRGARIVSISPGMIATPMGRRELADTPGAAELGAAAPLGRHGTAADIALAAHFLASDAAAFVTGTDLRVDGGAVAAVRASAG